MELKTKKSKFVLEGRVKARDEQLLFLPTSIGQTLRSPAHSDVSGKETFDRLSAVENLRYRVSAV